MDAYLLLIGNQLSLSRRPTTWNCLITLQKTGCKHTHPPMILIKNPTKGIVFANCCIRRQLNGNQSISTTNDLRQRIPADDSKVIVFKVGLNTWCMYDFFFSVGRAPPLPCNYLSQHLFFLNVRSDNLLSLSHFQITDRLHLVYTNLF